MNNNNNNTNNNINRYNNNKGIMPIDKCQKSSERNKEKSPQRVIVHAPNKLLSNTTHDSEGQSAVDEGKCLPYNKNMVGASCP